MSPDGKLHRDWAGRPAQKLLHRAIQVIKLHRSILDRQLRRTGVYRSQHQMLMLIADNPDASQRDVAQALNVSAATIAVSLKKLERGGYINRIVDENDNRFNQIRITEKGMAVVKMSREFFRSVEERVFLGFTEEELNLMKSFMDRAYENLLQLSSETEKEER